MRHKNNATPRGQAEPKAYIDKDTGILYVPGANLYAAIISAGVFHRSGRMKLTTAKSSLVTAGVILEELVCSLGTKDWECDSRSVVNPNTGGRIMCHRPRVDVWSTTFTLDIDTEMFSENLVRALVDDAGKKIGLGDFRPSRRGPFGRFVVVGWEQIAEELAA